MTSCTERFIKLRKIKKEIEIYQGFDSTIEDLYNSP